MTYLQILHQTYWRCESCALIFLDPSERLDTAKEKARYEKHENNVLDQGYQQFVNPLYQAVTKSQSPEDKGLDYGSGPDSAISHLLKLEKYNILKYDPYFCDEPQILTANTYDYIIVCEVAEHFYDPKSEFEKLKSYLKPGGHLFVMTSLMTDQIDFATWSYRRDVTHVCFYSAPTCDFIKTQAGFKSAHVHANLVITFVN
ncbi:MAG: class I SAM-dependent methyltransferase [Bdellovibrio sp.]|nr:class I SAM-dependent methyltransferase [Bdellovibrio sp.]